MSLNYLYFGSHWRNLSSPLTHWHRGTAFQIDIVKDHPELQVVGEIGTDVVVVTMAARITHSILTLTRNLRHRRPLGWKNKAFQAVLWMCWKMIDLLLAMELTNNFVYKNFSKHSSHVHTEQPMNNISIECHWGCDMEINKWNMVPEEEQSGSRMENLPGNTLIEEACDHVVFSDMDMMVSKETLLPASCTNPFILSMICIPSEDGGSSLPSEESDLEFESEGEFDGDCTLPYAESSLSEPENRDEEIEKDSSPEETSVDSGMQESWTPKSKEVIDDSEEESDWSDEEDDSWDAESDADNSVADDLWASFCRNDDPYNPLSFSMPTRGPKQQLKEEGLVTHPENGHISVVAEHGECHTVNSTKKSPAKKPVLSSFTCSHKCANQKEKSESFEELKQTRSPGAKMVRFSSDVTVHRMVTWNYAYRMARKGPWEEYARDRSRFQKRIAETEAAIGFCLEPHHREKIWAASYCTENKS